MAGAGLRGLAVQSSTLPADVKPVARLVSERSLVVYPIVGVLAAGVYALAPNAEMQAVYNVVVGLITASLISIGALRSRRVGDGAWLIFMVGHLLWVTGDACLAFDQLTSGHHPYPSWPDVFYLSAYPLLAISVFRLGRQWRRWDRSGLLDTAITASGLGLVYWVAVVGPVAGDRRISAADRTVTVAYPVMAVLLCAVVLPLLANRRRRTPSAWLLIAGSIATLVSTVGYSFVPETEPLLRSVVFGGFLFTYTCFAGAAIHPSARSLEVAAPAEVFGRGRLVMLTVSVLLPAGVLLTSGLRHSAAVPWLSASVGSIVLSLLVMARLAGFVTTTSAQAGQLNFMAMRDDLTGLANRRSFEKILGANLPEHQVHVMLLDLNGFKAVNDHFGHAVGDDLLIAVARRLAQILRPEDMVARMGGDEFAILILQATDSGVDGIAQRVTEAFNAPVQVSAHQLLVTASIGAVSGTDIKDPVEILRRADLAMYDAKRNRCKSHRWYDPQLDEATHWRAQTAEDLRAALGTDQLQVVYQPIVSLPDGQTRYVEALLRWQHPTHGYISPADFIPVAEESSLITELGEHVLRTACSQAVIWRGTHPDAAPEKLSVNVSARQLAETGFVPALTQILAEVGWAAHNLIVEVTETAVFAGAQTVHAVRDLHNLGVLIALDDFGTGHSSLGLLQTVPVDILKVDKSFVDNITRAGRHLVIADALIHISHGLGLSAVAEGVETAEQARTLYDLGYRFAQGYHFAKPGPVLAVEAAFARLNPAPVG